jgi:hypothetical protein
MSSGRQSLGSLTLIWFFWAPFLQLGQCQIASILLHEAKSVGLAISNTTSSLYVARSSFKQVCDFHNILLAQRELFY